MIRFGCGRRRWVAVGVVGVLCWGCETAEWTNLRVASPYRRPSYGVNVSVTMGPSGAGVAEYIEGLTNDLVAELHDVGLDATVDMASPASAQLTLQVVEWDPGDQAVSMLVAYGAGEGMVAMVVDLKEPGGKTLLHGRIQSHLRGGIHGGSPHDVERAQASAIAALVNTGR